MIKLYPYRKGSHTVKALQQGLEHSKIIKLENSRYRPKPHHLIINWGNSHIPSWWMHPWGEILNHPYYVRISANKLDAFQTFRQKNVATPEWTTKTEIAQQWIDEGSLVYGRQVLNGNSGQGIILLDHETITSEKICPLYTKATKCKYEYRVHIVKNEIIDFVRKKKRTLLPEEEQFYNPHIRSHVHGWIFARENVTLPEIVKEEALKAVAVLGLDFGAVDVGYSVTQDKAFIYEINTAPGLTGTSLQRYIAAFKRIANEQT